MPYYPTLAEDVARAKQILAKGQPSTWEKANFTPEVVEALRAVGGGTIYGADIYAAYKLLESFVEVIEAVDVKVCELAWRHRVKLGEVRQAVRAELDAECVCRTPGCGHPASDHDGHGGCTRCQRGSCWS